MEFDKSKVYTALNADELKVGSKVIVANNMESLKCKVDDESDITEVVEIFGENCERRFKTASTDSWPLAYFVSESETWIVYLWRRKGVKPYLTACSSDRWESVKEEYGAKTKLFEGTENECYKWYTSRKHLSDEIAAWEDGEYIQFFDKSTCDWHIAGVPNWNVDTQFRIKPEEKKLKWTDLKAGDVIEININTREMNLKVSDEVLAERKKNWTPREPKINSGYLARYRQLVTSGNRGAILEIPKN